MKKDALEVFASAISSAWGPLTTELIAECYRQMVVLVGSSAAEEWLATLHRDLPTSSELYRDPDHGFILLAHTEEAGLYRPPHDHGRGWVIYAVQRGEVEMGSYAKLEDTAGGHRLVKRDVSLVRSGQVQVYLPGDIHDTLCVKGPALLFRFAERDLKREEKEYHRVTRFVQRGGAWVANVA